jgi:hypothetical protein
VHSSVASGAESGDGGDGTQVHLAACHHSDRLAAADDPTEFFRPDAEAGPAAGPDSGTGDSGDAGTTDQTSSESEEGR